MTLTAATRLPTLKDGLNKVIRACFVEAAKIHWGPQRVTVRGTVVNQNGEGALADGVVVESTLQDAKSNACFGAALSAARFRLDDGLLGREQTLTFSFVPKAH